MLFTEHSRLATSIMARNDARQIPKISLETNLQQYYLGYLVVEKQNCF
jgi:hypothetical protein